MMISPRTLIMPLPMAALAACLLFCAAAAAGQSRRVSGPARSGDDGRYAAAKSSYEAAAYQQALDELEALLKVAPDHADALYLKYRVLMSMFAASPPLTPSERSSREISRERRTAQAELLNRAAESLGKYMSLAPNAQNDPVLRNQLEALLILAKPVTGPESERRLLFREEVAEEANILRRPPPRVPERLRGSRLGGRVRVLVILEADGRVGPVLVVKTPSRELTEASLDAAREIRFEPATKDGRAVSTVVLVEYGFDIF